MGKLVGGLQLKQGDINCMHVHQRVGSILEVPPAKKRQSHRTRRWNWHPLGLNLL